MKIYNLIAIIFLVLGSLLFLVGGLFKILHWPDLFFGYVSGPICIGVGIVLLVINKIKK